MPSIFYPTADGRVVRRVYRNTSELSGAALAQALGIDDNSYTDAEMKEMIRRTGGVKSYVTADVTAQYKARILELAANEPPKVTRNAADTKNLFSFKGGNIKVAMVVRKIRGELLKASGTAAFAIPGVGTVGGLCLAVAGGILTNEAFGQKADEAELTRLQADLETLRGAYVDYQARLRDQWLAQRKEKALWEAIGGTISKGITLADAYALQSAELAARTKADEVANIDANCPPPSAGAEARVAYLEAALAQKTDQLAQTADEVARLTEEAKIKNKVGYVRDHGVEAVVPRTKEEAEAKEHGSGWATPLLAAIGSFIMSNATKPSTKIIAKKLATDIYNDAVGFRFKASSKYKYTKAYEALKHENDQLVQEEQMQAQERQAIFAELEPRCIALTNHPHLLKEPTQAVWKKLRNWITDAPNAESIGSIRRAIEALEAASANPRSPYYKE